MGASIYKASAGAGKTYLLVQHYIAFCLQPHHRFDQALAITFTNKAAGEMKARILEMLQALATGVAPATYIDQLQQIMSQKRGYTRLTNEQIQYRASTTRSDILHRYGQFAVGTIDAFFQRILRSFARELELSVNYNLELDQFAILQEVTDQLLDQLGDDTRLTAWLLQFMRDKIHEGNSWNLEKDLFEFSKQLLQPQWQEISTAHPDLRAAVQQLKQDLHKVMATYVQDMDRIGREGLALITQFGLSYDLFHGGKSGIANHFNKIQRTKGDYAPTTSVLSAVNGTKGHRAQKHTLGNQLDAAWEAGVGDKLQEAVTYYDRHSKDYETAKMTLQYLNQLGILNDMAQLLKQIRDDRDLLLISDTNHLLASLTQETDTPFVYEKVGQQYRFFLLDEFQDTSNQQWDNLLPLLQHALDSDNEVLIVGDVKQSIYRWRGGNMELLREQVQQHFQLYPGYSSATIESNWRSLPAIVAFNNAFFRTLPQKLSPALIEMDTEQLLPQLFADVEQVSKRKDTKQGYVQIDLIPFDREETDLDSWRHQHLQQIVPLIQRVLADGYAGKDICFLVDTHKDGSLLAQFLSEKGYKVISQDSLLLGNSRVIQLIIRTLSWLTQPAERFLQLQMVHAFNTWKTDAITAQQLLQKLSLQNQPLDHVGAFPLALKQAASSLLRMPLYDMIEHILQAYGLDGSGDAFVTQFMDKVLAYTQDEDAMLPTFLDWWEEKGQSEALATTATTEAMQIMTIHKAKGLQFPVVFTPFLEFSNQPKHPPLLWLPAPHVSPYPADMLLPIKYTTKGENTYFNQYFNQEQVKHVADTLNKWYVAFTRAGDRLYVLVNDQEKSRPDSAVLFQSILTSEDKIDSETFSAHWQESQGRFSFGTPDPKVQEEREKTAWIVDVHERSPWQTRVRLQATTRSIESNTPAQQMDQLQYGQLFHELFSRLDRLEEVPQVLQALVLEGWCKSSTAESLQEELDILLKSSDLSTWFDASWQSIREQDLLLPGGITRRPDRVIVKGKEARVLDYKTGQPKESDRVQVQEYAQTLRQMGYTVTAASIFYTATATFKNVS